MDRSIGAALLLLVTLLGASPAWSQAIERLGDFTDWSAYRFVEGGQPACYIASQPKTAKTEIMMLAAIEILIRFARFCRMASRSFNTA